MLTDGDTVTVLDEDSRQHKIRLEGESHAREWTRIWNGREARAVRQGVRQIHVVERREKDKYGRTLGHIYLDGRHINLELVADGYAWHFKQYNTDA